MIPIWFAIPFLIKERFDRWKTEQTMKAAQEKVRKQGIQNDKTEKWRQINLDNWCESMKALGILSDQFYEKRNGHWYAKENKGGKNGK